jgi:hypothetical protein
MNSSKGTLRFWNALVMLLFAGFFLPVFAQSQDAESLIVTAKGHGEISVRVEKRKITAALVVLRKDSTVMITVTTDLQLQLQGTWKANIASPEEIALKITGGAVADDLDGSGKLVLTSDRKSLKELTINAKSADGQEITVTFAADDSEPPK